MKKTIVTIVVIFSSHFIIAQEYRTVTDIDGNVYQTVQIGDQFWMAENLKVTHYQNGDEIPCNVYNDDPSNAALYGRLYTWYALDDERGICPDGWHVPSDDEADSEWQILVDYLGGGSVAGGKMKATGTIEAGDGLWKTPNEGATNESGFTGLPGGFRDDSGVYDELSITGYFWTSTEEHSSASYQRSLYYDWEGISGFAISKSRGFSVRCVAGPTSGITVDYQSDWNLVGLPLEVEDASYNLIFPESIEGTLYSFDDGYILETSLIQGEGYWLRFANAGSTTIDGTLINTLTISLNEGWNLITGISSPVAVESISDPGGIIVSGTIYGYSSSYYNADAIEPGKGYWINASADGDVTFGDGVARSRPVFEDMTAGANTLTIDGQDLCFGIDIPADKMMSYSLPPKPPPGAFDVRFSGDTRIGGKNSEIEVMSPYETITISYDVVLDAGEYMHWVLTSESGDEYILEEDGEITVPTEDTFTLARVPVIPIAYALHQNYPNPFNPITTLRYDLPVDNHVTIIIYDLSGREVNRIVNASQPAGHHSVMWNSTNSFGKPVSAGVYLYQIRAGDFVQTRKMVLLK